MTTTKRSNPPAEQAASKPRLTDEQVCELIRKHCAAANGWRDALRLFRGAGSSCAGQRFKGLFETVGKAQPAEKKTTPKKAPPAERGNTAR